jgi:hypothetical protein
MSMRNALAIAALVAMPSAALAQSASQQINLNAFVDSYCTIDGSASSSSRTATVATANGQVAPGPLSLSGSSGTVVCSTNAKIQLTTANGGLKNAATPPDESHVNRIHYVASAGYNGMTETLTTSDATPANFTTTGTTTTAGARSNAPLTVGVTSVATTPGKALVSGSYTDVITVTLTPAP